MIVILVCAAAGDPKMALEDIPLGVGPLQQFAEPVAAQRHCPGSEVVWTDPGTGYFHPQGSPAFRQARTGFACKTDALAADYWDINPFAGNLHHGREFPIDPSLRPGS